MKRTLVAVGVIGLCALIAAPFFNQPSDKELVQHALDQAVEASRRGEPGGVLEHLSKSFTFNDEATYSPTDIAKAVRTAKPEITLIRPETTIDGARALVVTDVQLASSGWIPLAGTLKDVTIVLKRETGTRWLVFPVPKWRVTDVRLSESLNLDP